MQIKIISNLKSSQSHFCICYCFTPSSIPVISRLNISAIPDFSLILLTWEPPKGPRSDITAYEVSHRLVAQPENVTRENTTDLTRRLTVSGLEPGTEVTFTVRAYSRGGAGEEVTVTVSTLTRPRE